jgi:hypothetical protein
MRPPSNKTRNKANSPSDQKLSPTKYFILEKDERLLRYAALYLEIKGEKIHTPQQMLQHAASKYVDYLKKQYSIVFPDYLTSESPTPTPEDPA